VWILVERLGPEGWQKYPAPILGVELPNEMAVWERWGGGKYRLHGRNGQHYTAHVSFDLDGPRKPLRPDTGSPVPPPIPAPVPAAAGGGSDMGFVFQFLMAELNASREQQARIFAASQENQAAHLQAMASMYQAQTQGLMALMRDRHESSDPSEAFARGVELAQTFIQGRNDGAAAAQTSELDALKQGFDVFDRFQQSAEGRGNKKDIPNEQTKEEETDDD
jgi:hypothetical protein